jgi:type IV fimbrial biogenesis protein FimT
MPVQTDHRVSDEAMKKACNDSRVSRQSGLTIIEIMVTLAIAGVLIGLAVPAFNAFVAQRSLTAQVNDFLVAVQYARSEAGRRGTVVSVLALDATNAANEWGPGWCVVVGNPAPAACPNDATELRRYPALGANTLNATGALSGLTTLSFSSRGMLLPPAAAGGLNLCNPSEDVGRQIAISAIGRVSSHTPTVAVLDCNP